MADKNIIGTDICIAGGGPAGIMLGYLLARSGVEVMVLEKHSDFLRDFRGDTVHPSTLEVLSECGLKEKFDAIPQHHIQNAAIHIGAQVLQNSPGARVPEPGVQRRTSVVLYRDESPVLRRQ